MVVFLIGKTVEAVLLWVRAFYLLALFAPCLLVGAFVDKDGGRLRTFWMHLLLRSLEAAGRYMTEYDLYLL